MDQNVASGQVRTEVVDWSRRPPPDAKLPRAILLGPVSLVACFIIAARWNSTIGGIVAALWIVFSLGMSIYALVLFLKSMAAGSRAKKPINLRKALEDYSGQTKYCDTFFGVGGASAIALNPAAKMLVIADKNMFTSIPWAAVRTWRWSKEGHERISIVGGNLGQHAQAGMLNMGASYRADMDSGITFEVKDINSPTIRFRCDNVPLLQRWHEILRQFNEGELR